MNTKDLRSFKTSVIKAIFFKEDADHPVNIGHEYLRGFSGNDEGTPRKDHDDRLKDAKYLNHANKVGKAIKETQPNWAKDDLAKHGYKAGVGYSYAREDGYPHKRAVELISKEIPEGHHKDIIDHAGKAMEDMGWL